MRHASAVPAAPDLAAQLLATETYLAWLDLTPAGLMVRPADFVRAAGFDYPARGADDDGFWNQLADRLRTVPADQQATGLLAARGEQLYEVRLCRTAAASWLARWSLLADPWVDERGRRLLPTPANERATSVLLASDGTVLATGEGYRRVLGGPASVLGQRWPASMGPGSADTAEQILRELATGPVDRIVPSVRARPRWFRVQGRHAVQGGTGRPVVVIQAEDLTDEWGSSLVAQLIRDPLTGLYNRRAFFDLAGLPAASTAMFQAVLLLDVRGLTRINELWGQQVGDRCLVETADWLRSMAGAGDVLVKLSGSEFIALCTPRSPLPARLAAGNDRTLLLDGRRIVLSLRAGVAARLPGASLLLAAEDAETALAVAKRDSWRTVVPWTAELSRDAAALAAAEDAVLQATIAHQESVVFQPVVDLAERRVSGVEALVRLGGPAGALPTDQVLAASHKLGLTPTLAGRVYDLAFAEGSRLRTVFPGCLLGVNVSREFLSTGLAIDTVRDAADRAGVARDQVVVELTEDLAAGLSSELLCSELRRGAGLGMRMVIDDFGRGETSLSVLRTLPLWAIKLDRSLLPLDDDERAWDFVERTVGLLSTLTERIVAEGIETLLQASRLRGVGVHLQQGYFFGQPETSGHWLRAGLRLPPL